MTEPDEPTPEPEEITLEEWIAASQSCCGVETESRREPKPPTTPPNQVQSGDAPPTV